MKHTIICPHCQTENSHIFNTLNSNYDINCSYCNNTFFSRVVKIRAKRSRGNKKYGSRNFAIRIIEFSGKEDLIEFENLNYEDFELRQKDLAVFSFIKSYLKKDLAGFSFKNNYLKIVQNLTIDRNYYVTIDKNYHENYYVCDIEDSLFTKIFRFFVG